MTDKGNVGEVVLDGHLDFQERRRLLDLAREALEAGVRGEKISKLDLLKLPIRLQQHGASFVTLTNGENLRGCIGALEASRPLAEDVRIHAVTAAMEDYRFPPVLPEELTQIRIEISYLTPLKPVEYSTLEELLTKLRPGTDGVVLVNGTRRATLLPQVWCKVPKTDIFLDVLCRKMGLPGDTWRVKKLGVFVYEVEEFHE